MKSTVASRLLLKTASTQKLLELQESLNNESHGGNIAARCALKLEQRKKLSKNPTPLVASLFGVLSSKSQTSSPSNYGYKDKFSSGDYQYNLAQEVGVQE